jgi:hypothetical protein
LFSPNPNPDPFIQSRATATNSGVPGAIFRFASQLPNGPQSVFDAPNGFLDITKQVYVCHYHTCYQYLPVDVLNHFSQTQHLSVSAKSIYFVGTNVTLNSKMTFLAPRLWIEYVISLHV